MEAVRLYKVLPTQNTWKEEGWAGQERGKGLNASRPGSVHSGVAVRYSWVSERKTSQMTRRGPRLLGETRQLRS